MILRCNNYSSGSSGFKIEGGGDAEFNNVTVRGALITQSGSSLDGGYLTSGSVVYGALAANSVRANELYIDDDINFAANGTLHDILGVDGIYRSVTAQTTEPYVQLWASKMYLGGGAGSQITLDGSLHKIALSATGAVEVKGDTSLALESYGGDVTLNAGDDIILNVADAASALTVYDWTTTTGGNNYAGGSILIKVGSSLRRIKLWKT